MKQVPFGNTGRQVGAIGFGAMRLASKGPHPDATALLLRAFELGMTLIDTADRYCPDEQQKHLNERQIAEALQSYPGDPANICVATKGGMLRPAGMWVRYGQPEHIARTIRESFEVLGGERPIPLWQYHQVDRNYPLEETLAAIKDAVNEGLIQHVGLSNVDVRQLEQARQIVDIASVQCEYNLWCRGVERNGVLDFCQQHGLALLAWRPLGGPERAAQLDHVPAIAELASARHVSPAQLALAWLSARAACVFPIPGTARLASWN